MKQQAQDIQEAYAEQLQNEWENHACYRFKGDYCSVCVLYFDYLELRSMGGDQDE